MRQLFANGWDLADNLLGTFAQLGYFLDPGTRILDFGCGGGGLVYRLRDLGFDAYGFDIHERVDYRDPQDRRFFGFIDNPTADTSNAIVSRERFRLPFEADMFDVVISTSVLEHVMDLPPVMSEIARVLKPSGFSFHVYPKKSIVIEPHIFVPFGSRWQSWRYFHFWGLLGVRNQYQEAMSPREVADNNVLYSRTGLKYLSQRELFEICAEHFDEVRFVDQAYYYYAHPLGPLVDRVRALRSASPLRAMAETQRLGALLTARKVAPGAPHRERPQWRGRAWKTFTRRARTLLRG
jgi:SAM-dependent methyltransferase